MIQLNKGLQELWYSIIIYMQSAICICDVDVAAIQCL